MTVRPNLIALLAELNHQQADADDQRRRAQRDRNERLFRAFLEMSFHQETNATYAILFTDYS
jgi:hypothetical protein